MILHPIANPNHCAHVDAWHEAGRLGMIERRNRNAVEALNRTDGERRRRRVVEIVSGIMAAA